MRLLKRRKDMKYHISCSLIISFTSFAIANSVESSFLRRHRTNQNEVATKAAESNANSKIEDLWERAVIAANLEMAIERDLLSSSDFAMSMPTNSPSNPSNPTTVPVNPSQSPSQAPANCLQGRTREEYIMDVLSPITPESILVDSSTPQGQAFGFLANDDPGLQDPCSSSTIEQRYGLATFYYALEGENWFETDGWLSGSSECEWLGVECGDNSNMIQFLRLQENNLVGSLPGEISTLATLERLELFSNNIFGTIPTEISELSSLLLLDVEQNLLTGDVVPSSVLDSTSLVAYRASSNFLEGTIPQEIRKLQNLEQLWLGDVSLTGTIPSQIGSLSELQYLFLYDNAFQGSLMGSLPTEIGTLSKLVDLRLYGNQLRGSIPSELFGATSLESLILDQNFFDGTLPTEVGNLSNLAYFRVDGNQLSGTIPTEIGRMVHLENFIVNTNWFGGQIPNVFGGFDRLDFIDVSSNVLNGTIPDSIFEVPTLRLAYFSNNSIVGTIPPNYSKPPLLRDLFFDGNGLTGSIPPLMQAGDLQDLNELLLQNNFLSGSMPSSVCDLRGDAGDLDDLFADCGGQNPRVLCSFPSCCNRCNEIESSSER